MKKTQLLIATALGAGMVTPAMAQTNASTTGTANAPIIVTAQRQAQTLQEVPIAVSAFDSQALESQQIESVSDLQLSLPNITFSKGNFTGSSLAIRGVGNLCVGFSCDSALGIHINGMPVLATRLFETEYFDLERIEVLRGPQGTLYGRNATSGVLNTITARPDLGGFSASAEVEYGNFDAMRAEGMVNIPLTDWAGIRVAGSYINRDGYTTNLFDGSDIDGRDQWAIRGSLRLEPGPDTTIDIIGYYFEEDSNRSRIQKQLCDRDPTGVLGCLPTQLQNEPVNANATLASIFASAEVLAGAGGVQFAPLGLTSIYGPDQYAGVVVPADVRTVNIDFNPTYQADEWFVMGQIDHDFGPVSIQLTGGWQETSIDTRTDYNLTAAPPFGAQARNAFNTVAALSADPTLGRFFAPVSAALFPNGPGGVACTSEADLTYAGVYGGNIAGCSNRSIEFDRSTSDARQYSIEAILTSDFDGAFNFLIGGIYFNHRNRGGDYFVNAFGLDYASGVLGALTSAGTAAAVGQAAAAAVLAGGGSPADAQAAATAAAAQIPASYLGPSMFNSETELFTLESYGLFGEVYIDITDNLRLTGGIRYSNDEKFVRARSPLFVGLVPFGTTDVFGFMNAGGNFGEFDFDPNIAGIQPYAEESASFDEVTGRIVLDWQWTPDNLLYASWSRGYKSGGINPPINRTEFPSVPITFQPEIINAFEVGSKNTLAGGAVQLNASIFYYDYQDLQLSRILARTSINTNTSAEVWGVELEAIVSPDPAWLFNFTASYLNTSVGDLQIIDSRDPSGGRNDVVIIKNLDNASNCAVIPDAVGNVAGANGFVNFVNGQAGLQPTVPIPGTTTTGAFSSCSALTNVAASGALDAVFGTFTIAEGNPVDVTGNELPQAPNWKFSIGGQYTHDFNNGMSLVLRGDYAFTGDQWSRTFNSPIDRIPSYGIANAQVQLNGRDDRWFARAFIQNIFDNDAITGQYVTDPSSGLFTNIFTLEPRRYGLAVGVRF